MTTHTATGRRLITTGVLVVLGLAIAAGAWIGGQRGFAVGLAIFYVVCGVVVYLWTRGSGDVAAIMRVDGDERQRQLDLRATAISGLAMGLFCIGATVVDLARGGSGMPWATVCAVGGVAYVGGLAIARRRH
jgi:hypothetical protein